jgi:hypothetical protein
MKSPARRFTLVMLSACALFVGGPVLLNYIVDPYDRFGNNRMGIYISAEREAKATEVERQEHTALLLGNSRIAAIPPSRLVGFRFFNGAFSAANAEDVYWFVQHHAHRQKLVVLGIDLGATDPPALNGDIFRRGDWASAAEHLVNLQTVEYSIKTLISYLTGKRSHYLPDGSLAEVDFGNASKPRNVAFERAFMERMKNGIARHILHPPWSLSHYRKIAATLRERKIPCVVVVPPMHEELIRHIAAMRLDDECREWLEGLRAIFPNVVDLSSSPYGAAANFYDVDPVHFKADAGVRFMNEQVLPFAMEVLRNRGQ